ncbi:MAG: ribosomal protein L7/L12 [Oscillospiraceae bacterium]|nr:ribosomal protein L7/L12 [Oscillospiraceae bacterium]
MSFFSIFRSKRGAKNQDSTTANTVQKYEGEQLNGQPHGMGTMVYPSGNTYTGEWKNGVRNGNGEYVFASTGEKYVGEFADGEYCGKGKYYYQAGAVYEGQFMNSERCGMGIITYKDGSRYEGSWVADKRTGYGKMFYTDGRVYRGMFLNGDMTDGFMTMKNENGEWEDTRYGTQVDFTAVPLLFLVSYPEENKIQVIKEVRELTGWGLAHAKDVVENVPQLIKTRATPEDIDETMARLDPLGAVIKMK